MGTPSSITESDSWTREAFSFPAEQRSEHYKNSWSTTVLMLMDYVSTCANLVSRLESFVMTRLVVNPLLIEMFLHSTNYRLKNR